MRTPGKKNDRAYTQGCLSLPPVVDGPRAKAPDRRQPSFDFDLSFRNALSRALKESELSRAEIAARMTDLMYGDAGTSEVTKAQIDGWSAPSREAWRFPISHLPALVAATGAVWLLELVANACGCTTVSDEQAGLVELGRIAAARQDLDGRERDILRALPKELREAVRGDRARR